MLPPLDPARDGWPAGPRQLVLVGPPGTGKTTSVLATWLLPALRAGVRPDDVLAVSFTKAAASELANRLGRELDVDPDDLRRSSCTIHAEARRLVSRDRPVDVMDDHHARVQPDEDDEEGAEPVRIRRSVRGPMLTVWDYARATMAPGDTIAERLEAVWEEVFSSQLSFRKLELAEIVDDCQAYERQKANERKIDFSDMLSIALERGEVPARELLIVDEAQDCSPLQWRVIESWARHAKRVVLVGDPDQAVHTWAGADPRPMVARLRDPNWAARRLAQSWRVPRAAHRLARELILLDRDRVDAPYAAADRDGQACELDVAGAVDRVDEAARLGLDVLVLARGRKLLAGFGAHLAAAGVPYHSERGCSPLSTNTSPVAKRPSLKITRAAVGLRMEGRARCRDAAVMLSRLPGPHFPTRRKAVTVDLVKTWPEDAYLERATLEALGIDASPVLAGELEDALTLLLPKDEGPTLPRELALLVERYGRDVLEHRPTVSLTSCHASKGREADLVVIDLEAPKPCARRIGNGDDLEERRLLYVGLTRTKDALVLLRPASPQVDLGELLRLPRLPVPARRVTMST